MSKGWRAAPAFPLYEVSHEGEIRSRKSGRCLRPSRNAEGHLKVNLTREKRVYTRSLDQLIAKAFLPEPERDDFRSVIHLDGLKDNCLVDNLTWRPRYFSILFHQQFRYPNFLSSRVRIVDLKTREEYPDIQTAVITHGLLFNDVLASLHNRTVVWPTFQQFGEL